MFTWLFGNRNYDLYLAERREHHNTKLALAGARLRIAHKNRLLLDAENTIKKLIKELESQTLPRNNPHMCSDTTTITWTDLDGNIHAATKEQYEAAEKAIKEIECKVENMTKKMFKNTNAFYDDKWWE